MGWGRVNRCLCSFLSFAVFEKGNKGQVYVCICEWMKRMNYNLLSYMQTYNQEESRCLSCISADICLVKINAKHSFQSSEDSSSFIPICTLWQVTFLPFSTINLFCPLHLNIFSRLSKSAIPEPSLWTKQVSVLLQPWVGKQKTRSWLETPLTISGSSQ